MNAEEITIRIGYDDDGSIHWADIPEDKEALIKKALVFRHKERQQAKREAQKGGQTMTREEARQILIRHNQWRRGAEIPMESPKVIGEAIDVLTKED